MVIHEGCHMSIITMAEIDGSTPKELYRGEIDQSNIEMLTALLVERWAGTKIIGIIMKMGRIIRITQGPFIRACVIARKW